MIDTGATHCSITEELAHKINLNPVGVSTIGTAGHPIRCNQYVVCLWILVTEIHAWKETLNNKNKQKEIVPKSMTHHLKTHITRVSAMPKQKTVRGFDVIIGMDLLGKMTFQYSGNPAFPVGDLTIGF